LKKMSKAISNWMLGEFAKLLNAAGITIEVAKITPVLLIEFLELIDKGTLSGPAAKVVFEEMFSSGRSAAEIVEKLGLAQISDAKEIEMIVDRVIGSNEQAVADYKKGKEQALKFLIGQIMRETRGRANHAVVNELLKQKLGA